MALPATRRSAASLKALCAASGRFFPLATLGSSAGVPLPATSITLQTPFDVMVTTLGFSSLAFHELNTASDRLEHVGGGHHAKQPVDP